MSGIAGIYYLDDRPVDLIDLRRMSNTLAHRGPDHLGVWNEGSVGFGHRMLWTTPESLHEKLPFVNQSGNLVITADARIDNRDELINKLRLTNQLPKEISDSELILAAYQKWGEHCLNNLIGDYTFAIWDRYKKVIFCARDHLGVKPFYYYLSRKTFAFASEIKALFCLPEVPRQPNDVMIAYYLVGKLEDKIMTFYQEILRLPPAHSMIVSSENSLRLQQYWFLDPKSELRLGCDKEYTEAFREIFTEAVRCRLRSIYPVGFLLSGGLDSSSIICTAQKLLAEKTNTPLQSFSATFPKYPEADERHFINIVLQQGRIEPYYVQADYLNPFSNIKNFLWHQDQPFAPINLNINSALCEAAQRQGVRILLDGEDGDTVVSYGYDYFPELFRTLQWMSLSKEIIATSRLWNCSYKKLLKNYVLKPLIPNSLIQAWETLRSDHNQENPWLVNKTISFTFAKDVNLNEQVKAHLKRYNKSVRTQREQHWLNLTVDSISGFLEICDKEAAAYSIERRHPFWDKRLVEFCLALPPTQKFHHGWDRVVIRRAMANIIPKEIQWRVSKASLSAGFNHRMVTFGQTFLNNYTHNNLEIIEKYVDIPTLQKAFEIICHQPDHEYAVAVWSTVILSLWLTMPTETWGASSNGSIPSVRG